MLPALVVRLRTRRSTVLSTALLDPSEEEKGLPSCYYLTAFLKNTPQSVWIEGLVTVPLSLWSVELLGVYFINVWMFTHIKGWRLAEKEQWTGTHQVNLLVHRPLGKISFLYHWVPHSWQGLLVSADL